MFLIAGIRIGLEASIPFAVSEKFLPFCVQDEADYCVEFEETERLPAFSEKAIWNGHGFEVIPDGENIFLRVFYDERKNHVAYAVGSYDWEKKKIRVTYTKEGIPHINHTDGAFFHIAWESMMLHHERLIFHACCISTEFGGLLFSGRSGIGKSTQGNLWCEYENAELINGDRPVLYRENEKWTAYGSPYAGSSRCHVNKKVSVRAIVMLKQAECCAIRRLDILEAFRRVFAQMTASPWEPACMTLVCALTEKLISEVPVYELSCTPDQKAVDLLKKILTEGDAYDL